MKLIDKIRADIRAALDERSAADSEVKAIVAAAEARGEDLNADEAARFTEARAKVADIDVRVAGLRERLDVLAADEEARAAAERVAAEVGRFEPQLRGAKAERTYRPDTDPRGAQFLLDVARSSVFAGTPDWEAQQRIARHMSEERVERGASFESRAAGTGAFAGLVVPQYLVDYVAPAAAAGRPFANICNQHPLPPTGMSVNISRITTATSAAAQTENNAASETNIDDTLLTENIFTVAGQQTLSRQAIERGTGTEDVTLNDLVRRYQTALDSKLLNDATTGLTNVAQAVTYTDASPTAAELYPKVLQAQSQLEAVMLDQGVGDLYAVMHSRRWAWMQSQVGSTYPFIGQPGYAPQLGGANLATGYGQGVRGVLPNGIRVIVDNNIATNLGAGTNEDEIYVVNASELHLWEDPTAPMLIRTEAAVAASLGVLLVVYGYAAYSFRRYTNGHQKISGTGLVTPTF